MRGGALLAPADPQDRLTARSPASRSPLTQQQRVRGSHSGAEGAAVPHLVGGRAHVVRPARLRSAAGSGAACGTPLRHPPCTARPVARTRDHPSLVVTTQRCPLPLVKGEAPSQTPQRTTGRHLFAAIDPYWRSSCGGCTSRFRILPVGPMGSSSTSQTWRGYLYAATRSRADARSSVGVAVAPGLSCTAAPISSPRSVCGIPITATSATA